MSSPEVMLMLVAFACGCATTALIVSLHTAVVTKRKIRAMRCLDKHAVCDRDARVFSRGAKGRDESRLAQVIQPASGPRLTIIEGGQAGPGPIL